MASLDIAVLERLYTINQSRSVGGNISDLADDLEVILSLEGISKLQRFENTSKKSIWRFLTDIVEHWDYRIDCLRNLFKTVGRQIVKEAEERVSDRIKTKDASMEATIYVSAGGKGPGVTDNRDIFLNIKHLVDLTRGEIVSLIAHELVHAKLHYPERNNTEESFVMSILEEGFATLAQLPFDQDSKYRSDWEKYVLEVKENAELLDRKITAAKGNRSVIQQLYKDFLNGFGPGYAVGFVIVDRLGQENSASGLDDLIIRIRDHPLDVWRENIEGVSNSYWEERQDHFEH